MGGLHQGHGELIRLAAARGPVLVSVFVNPLQFGPAEDFDRYPRTLEADRDLAERCGAHALWAPAVDTVCLLYTSPSPRDKRQSRMPSSA